MGEKEEFVPKKVIFELTQQCECVDVDPIIKDIEWYEMQGICVFCPQCETQYSRYDEDEEEL